MTRCQRCETTIDPSQALYTSAGEAVCADCFDDSQLEDQQGRVQLVTPGRVVLAVAALALAVGRLALTLAG